MKLYTKANKMQKIIIILLLTSMCYFQPLNAANEMSCKPIDIFFVIFEPQTPPKKLLFKGPTNYRQLHVVRAFNHSWQGYKKYAWGHDTLKPLSMEFEEWFESGLTIVESLDTMYIMNLQTEFLRAKDWVATKLSFDKDRYVNLFEITIRVLGGLLSAYHLSGEKMFLIKATDLGNRLLPAFDTNTGIPYSDVNLATGGVTQPDWTTDSSMSEVTTIQLEFRDLSNSVSNKIFEEKASKVSKIVHGLEKLDGLIPMFINPFSGQLNRHSVITIGARADSYYEYLLKQWLQTGKRENDSLINDYKQAINAISKILLRKTPTNHTFIGELVNGNQFYPKMDHLVCFLPGTLLLGYKNGMPKSHLKLAKKLLKTCYQMYAKQPTFIAPELVHFRDDLEVKPADAFNLLRPEFIESLYYFYSITGKKTYQNMGWQIFQAFNRYSKVKNGFVSIRNVQDSNNVGHQDKMETFWMAETLKYFYLLFSDDRNEIDLDKFVFNTEAHLLPIKITS